MGFLLRSVGLLGGDLLGPDPQHPEHAPQRRDLDAVAVGDRLEIFKVADRLGGEHVDGDELCRQVRNRACVGHQPAAAEHDQVERGLYRAPDHGPAA
ncbi:hypothetical protein D3C72_1866130 [compost metagenome]